MNMRYVIGILIVLAMASCATVSSSTNVTVSYLDNAKQNYEAGEKALADGSFGEALAYFDHVRNKYPYSKYATESELKTADVLFSDERWLEAADAYDFFVRFHPIHEHLGYATFRAAQSNYNAMPSNFFLFPPGYTKDQKTTQDALAAIDRYITQFPNDEFITQAKEMRVNLREQIALQHMYVAKFYMAKKKWKGASYRYEEVVKDFSDTPSSRRASIELALIKRDYLNGTAEAKALLERIVKEYPDSSEAQEAASALKSFPEEKPVQAT